MRKYAAISQSTCKNFGKVLHCTRQELAAVSINGHHCLYRRNFHERRCSKESSRERKSFNDVGGEHHYRNIVEVLSFCVVQRLSES